MQTEVLAQESRFKEEEWSSLLDVARTFRYFVFESKYGYVDRLANAFNHRIAEVAVMEALREARSAADAGEKVHIPSETHVRKVVELMKKDLSAAKVLAALALAFPEKRGEE
ncbi:MAG: hypothetical protein QXN23_07380 [Candidatus Caldarchaeum sp.]|jgi:CRISPR type I-A-associated protein Csa5|uniref:Uncharacterized protein n=1 Tax=Caldiarchaeum subterraneum TaxID=311458 RepID=A0A7C4DYZ5_CALS0|nr:hypothetical protein [Candidatus Caldarchaeales archaeon]MDJ0272448.1 hypothetical protein [Candidatus Caldarchaeales archaeon]